MQSGQIAKGSIGFGSVSKSLRSATPPLSTRFQSFSFVTGGMIVVYGDEITFNFLDSLKIPWGEGTPVEEHLTAGYLYVWNVNQHKLVITDNQGSITKIKNIKTLADLALDLDIMQNHQFKIIVDSDRAGDTYPIVERLLGNRGIAKKVREKLINQSSQSIDLTTATDFNTRMQKAQASIGATRQLTYRGSTTRPPLHAGEVFLDKTVKPEDRWKLFSMWENNYHEAEKRIIRFTGEGKDAAFIRAHTCDLTQDGIFTQNYLLQGREFTSTRYRKEFKGIMAATGKALMIYLIAENLRTTSHVIDRWMLWQAWRWLARGSSTVPEEKIFDLSPNWGG